MITIVISKVTLTNIITYDDNANYAIFSLITIYAVNGLSHF